MQNSASLTRRKFMQTTAAGLASAMPAMANAAIRPRQNLPTSPVAIGRCRRYDFEQVKIVLGDLFDQIGGVRAMMNGKSVSVKINTTSYQAAGIYTLPNTLTVFTHPIVTLAACSLFEDYGARRVIICESHPTRDETRTAFVKQTYDVSLFESVLQHVEFENTRNLGTGSRYTTLPVGEGAYLYTAFDLNHRYVDTDVMVSIAKMKNHDIAGITLSMKNMFGITPNSLYGESGNENATAIRDRVLHNGTLSPGVSGEIQPVISHDAGFRVPRIVTDIVRARPIDLAIIDAIVSMHGGEGAWNGLQTGITVPNLLIAGKNCVCTDAVTAAVMGYDPEAEDWSKPFVNCSNILRLAADRGLGTNRLSEIDVGGVSIQDARYDYLPGLIR